MCDTLYVSAGRSATGTPLFAKNSDRERDEAQAVVRVPAATHPAGARLRCTHVEIPQARRTRALLLSKPWWTWGAEMGANDAGVVIGNEALFTRAASAEPGLLGMDLVRLALERADDAGTAVDVITRLLERHGQGGDCAVHRAFHYDNGYLVADARNAWIVETCGRHWAVRPARAVDAISNAPSIGADATRTADGAFDAFRDAGWLAADAPEDFAAAVTDPEPTARGDGAGRCGRARSLLEGHDGPIGPTDLMAILRDHGGDAAWRPDDLAAPPTLCMHARLESERPSQTVGSLVSVLDRDAPGAATHFVTGTAAPCLSVFRPAWIDAVPAGIDPAPAGRADAESLFWRHHGLHRHALADLPGVLARGATERDAADANTVAAALAATGEARAQRAAVVAAADARAERWLETLRTAAAATDATQTDPRWRADWEAVDRRCGAWEG
jgi:dipeptidase